MSPCYPTSGDGRVVPTNQSARGDRHGSHCGSDFGSNHALSSEPPRCCSSYNGLVPGPIRRARG